MDKGEAPSNLPGRVLLMKITKMNLCLTPNYSSGVKRNGPRGRREIWGLIHGFRLRGTLALGSHGR